jgi:hypothetical protein
MAAVLVPKKLVILELPLVEGSVGVSLSFVGVAMAGETIRGAAGVVATAELSKTSSSDSSSCAV